MSVWGALAGGVVGAAVLLSGLRLAQQVGWTRIDLPLILGTVFSDDRTRACAIGYAIHFVIGGLFALGYYAVFAAVGTAGWSFGLLLGIVHWAIVSGGLLNLLPAFHPRMGTPWTDARETPLLEPPGFMLSNYGRNTAVTTLILHLVYGAIVGAFAAGL